MINTSMLNDLLQSNTLKESLSFAAFHELRMISLADQFGLQNRYNSDIYPFDHVRDPFPLPNEQPTSSLLNFGSSPREPKLPNREPFFRVPQPSISQMATTAQKVQMESLLHRVTDADADDAVEQAVSFLSARFASDPESLNKIITRISALSQTGGRRQAPSPVGAMYLSGSGKSTQPCDIEC